MHRLKYEHNKTTDLFRHVFVNLVISTMSTANLHFTSLYTPHLSSHYFPDTLQNPPAPAFRHLPQSQVAYFLIACQYFRFCSVDQHVILLCRLLDTAHQLL